ncbi:uncharacterized protein N7446_009412 [Penicillium canescens]|uniref:Uncharacterized protein n=1 Tax=Penicillium canescens TaxID=5083 RepID=A0AAD6N633_PENCN|nr:uncharacterized protein N7446_009412 [Penicillium canescens]KAJ6034658.1 hypothetical protein N7460_008833 [Penicillium canescens]KAJ6046321.1 hypothetical protein N7444_007575 [Penicillium canescens]KAJ6053400.1 hypothetical protein N7446_009412 [Penicillium canescens]
MPLPANGPPVRRMRTDNTGFSGPTTAKEIDKVRPDRVNYRSTVVWLFGIPIISVRSWVVLTEHGSLLIDWMKELWHQTVAVVEAVMEMVEHEAWNIGTPTGYSCSRRQKCMTCVIPGRVGILSVDKDGKGLPCCD